MSGIMQKFSRKKGSTEKTEKDVKGQKKAAVRLSDRMVRILNRYSLLFHMLLACSVCFVIEWVSRHSFLEACEFVTDRNLVFLYNALLVFFTLMLVYIVKRRTAARALICVFWLLLGVINGCVLAKRVSPFSYTDIKMVGDLFTMQSNYFSNEEAMLAIAGVAVICLLLILLWLKGPKYQGRTHRLAGIFFVAVMACMIPGVTDAAVSNNVLTAYFENLAQGYKDYGFVYSFSSSVLDRGMSEPEEYSEEAVQSVLNQIGAGDETQASAENGENAGDSLRASLREHASVRTASSQEESAEHAAAAREERADGAEHADGSKESTRQEDTADTMDAQPEETAGAKAQEPEIPGETESSEWEHPNVICVLLESFVDPELITFLEMDTDPIPNFRSLYENYSSGYLEVPVVGAGTANTEFEILTGMGMQFFGLGEYPYKTILKETNCESIASDLKTLGYGAHAVHDNGGNFYSRANAFSMMGFDTFTCKEMMDIREYTPLGTWPQDDIMLEEVANSLDYTPDSPDFVYVITVESHGDYPKYEVIEDPDIHVSGVEDEEMAWAWEYYVNQIHEVDEFIGELIAMLEERGEPTFVYFFGDHLPTMDLTEEDMETGSLFLTQYATWNNLGLEKTDRDTASYQLTADMMDLLDIHTGTMIQFHQNRDSFATEEEYLDSMELLQYDILYGEHYVYGGENPYPASELEMGTQDIVIERVLETDNYYFITGDHYTKWSRVYVNDESVKTKYISSGMLRINKDALKEGLNRIVVNQVGSSSTIFRSSNQISYYKGSAE